MKFLSAFLALAHLLTVPSANASTKDIKGSRYSIKTSFKTNGKISFRFCDNKKIPEICERIGRASGYSQSELNEIKHDELIEARWKTGGVVVFGLVGGYVGAVYGLGMVFATGVASDSIAAGVMVYGTGAAVGTVPMWFDKLNPIHQFAQADVLDEEGLKSIKIYTKSNSDVLEIADLLEEVLPQ